jgi:plastocyanin
MRTLGMIGLALAALAVCAFVWVLPGGWRSGPREVVLVANGMAFGTSGVPGVNPTLRLKAGERVRLVLVNQDPGMKHDLVSPGIGLKIAVLDHGERAHQVLTVPREPGTYDYFCAFHALMMRGRMVVE